MDRWLASLSFADWQSAKQQTGLSALPAQCGLDADRTKFPALRLGFAAAALHPKEVGAGVKTRAGAKRGAFGAVSSKSPTGNRQSAIKKPHRNAV